MWVLIDHIKDQYEDLGYRQKPADLRHTVIPQVVAMGACPYVSSCLLLGTQFYLI